MIELLMCFLGGIDIEKGGYSFSGELAGKALALLCYLAVTNKQQSRDTLAGLLWSDFPEHRARSNLRDSLTSLRRTRLAPHVDIKRRSVSFNSGRPYWLDTAAFDEGIKLGLGVAPIDAPRLELAIELYKGEFLAGFQVSKAALFEEWVTIQRQNFHLSATRALQRLVDFHRDAGSYEAGIAHARRLLLLDPWREETHRNLMLLHLLTGEHTAALKQYEACQQILADELGVAPSNETQLLYQNIRKQIDHKPGTDRIHLGPEASPSISPAPHNISSQMTSFIGREKEQRAIEFALSDPAARLITIFGVGGSGKTRLALAVGQKQIQVIDRDGECRFRDGVFFVPLEAIESPAEIVPTLCQTLGFQPADESRAKLSIEEQLLNYLRHKRLLLILDNFEQLLAGVGLLSRINRAAENVHLLVTSRQKLALHGERLYALQGLRYPEAGEQVANSEELLANYSAAGLFAASARRVKPDFQLSDQEVPGLIRLCRLVDGLPLAIELAAGWTNVLSLADIVTEIEHGLSFLESDLHDLPDRHRNMKVVFEVSWQQLAREEQLLFSQLCIFRGGFTRQAAARIVGANLRQLATIVNKTLLQYDRELDRYQIHRLLRQFGAGKLAHHPQPEMIIRQRHCSFFSLVVQHWDEQLKGAGQLEALAEFEQENANVRSAWYYAVENGLLAELDQAADGLGRFYLWRRRFHEGEATTRLAEKTLLQALAVNEARENATEVMRLLAKIQIWQSVFCPQAPAKELVNKALAVLDNPELASVDIRCEQAFGLQRAGDLIFDSNSDESQRFYHQSLTLYRELNDTWGITRVLTALGWGGAHRGALEEARQHGEEALILSRASGDAKGTADALWMLGTLAVQQNQIEASGRLLGESLDIRQTLGDRITDIAAGPLDLGMTLTWIGRMAEADAVREETLALYEEQGQPEQIALAHVRLATSKLHVGQYEASERHARIGLELCQQVSNQRGAGLAVWLLATLSLIAGEDDQTESLLKESLAIFREVEGAGEIGWLFSNFAEVARRQGRPAQAKKCLYECIRTASGAFGMITILLGSVAYMHLLADEGQPERALEIGVFLQKNPSTGKSLAVRPLYAERLAEIKAFLSPEVVAEAEAQGHKRNVQETAAEILAEFEEFA
ncbi:MAG TPA: BTAD domain-containing putative transcriptional regulator [Anaerolineae bacterium]|nr:BTAD domain-containing putative transcriptional regulator [Anaerolineae bacterium]